MGIITVPEALQIAQQRGLDLVEVAPTAEPPVCRLLDYGKFRYEQARREREARKSQKVVSLKEMRLRPKIDDHDLACKTRLIQNFLRDGDKVKVTVIFRGREITHANLGRDILDQVTRDLGEMAVVERAPLMEGRNLTMILSPVAAKQGPAQAR